jgi:DNA-binding beta-propeller fold protein YncE
LAATYAFLGSIGKGSTKFDPNTAATGEPGTLLGEFTSPSGIVVDEAGFAYVIDAARGGRVQRLNSTDGKVIWEFLPGFVPGGIALDPSGYLWLSDPGGNRVLRYDFL